jgi:hypothetical protein
MEPVDVIPVYLHVPVHGASSVKFRSNYWLLQPWYIKQEMWPGLLHVYNSAFSCGYILRWVEMPQKHAVVPVAQEAKGKSAGTIP